MKTIIFFTAVCILFLLCFNLNIQMEVRHTLGLQQQITTLEQANQALRSQNLQTHQFKDTTNAPRCYTTTDHKLACLNPGANHYTVDPENQS